MSAHASFSKRRKLGMAGQIADVIRLAFADGQISSIFGLEGVMRASLRADLCLRGWRWLDADQAARDIVSGAHSLLGAKRPDWYEGQPEYVIAEGVLIERTRCKRCHKKLPENHYKFCGDVCRKSYHSVLFNLRHASELYAADLAIRSKW
ncbi:hypothetical protein [Planktotalea arctica]|uniref:hypothetical protein n=1 Tax=Planktotalea arctica TaxID=1481893 RepID=UPI00111C8E79|nr:hypothetical protein [Planktotalea arctica]